MSAHRLDGLEPDNWLAFMALLGLLRALDTARPEWRARAYWDDTRRPLRPVLTLAADADQAAVAAAAAEGVATLAVAHVFDRKNIKYNRDDYRVARDAGDNALFKALFDALLHDGAIRDDSTLWPSPLCFLFGQGHQNFLDRLAGVPRGTLPGRLAQRRNPPDLAAPTYLAAALFAPWRREDPTEGLRWDPAEDRRYALRARDPSGDTAGMQHGANRLAAVALPLFAGASIKRRSEARFLNLATGYAPDGRIRLTWPIWTVPARLPGIIALLAHPALATQTPELAALAPLGVTAAYRAHRISVGKFFNVTAGRAV